MNGCSFSGDVAGLVAESFELNCRGSFFKSRFMFLESRRGYVDEGGKEGGNERVLFFE